MGLFSKILFPVDLSEASKKIVPFVEDVVKKYGAELHIVYSMRVAHPYISPSMSAVYTDDVEPETRAEAENRMRGFIEAQIKDLSVQLKVLSGPPGPQITRYAEEEKIDLIIMGHSSTGIARAVFGSVAGSVVKHSHAPVLIISSSMLKNKV